MASKPPKRTRNAAATRNAILHSALAAFSRHGYDGIGVREIAQTAGVTGVLVNRYFGSKEELFSAVVELAFADNSLFQGDCTLLAQRLASTIVTKTKKRVLSPPIHSFYCCAPRQIRGRRRSCGTASLAILSGH